MIGFLLRRIIWGIPVLFVVATITFVMLRLVPGGPFDREKKLPPEIKANVEAKYHLNEPLIKQYLLYMGGLLKGDLGPSYKYIGRDVKDIIRDTFPVSIQLGLLAALFSVAVGIPLGILSAIKKDSIIDRGSMLISITGISLPNFVLGAILIVIFSHILKLFPPALWEDARHMVLPAITLGAGPAAYIARLMRTSVLDTLHKDFVRTAKAKGLPEHAVIIKHVVRNSLTPVVTIMGPLTAAFVTGSFIVEFIFSIPGMGRFFITAVTNRDYPLIMGVTLLYTFLIVVANIIVDILYAVLDPRVRVK